VRGRVRGRVRVRVRVRVRDRVRVRGSLCTLSPNTTAKMSSRTPMALKTASTLTGSVALTTAPKKNEARRDSG
jgi:hypothetical protein